MKNFAITKNKFFISAAHFSVENTLVLAFRITLTQCLFIYNHLNEVKNIIVTLPTYTVFLYRWTVFVEKKKTLTLLK